MVAGAATVILWTRFPELKAVYEMIPGFAASLIAIVMVSLLTPKPKNSVQVQFDHYNKVA